MSQMVIQVDFIKMQAAINATRKLLIDEFATREDIQTKAVVTAIHSWLNYLENNIHGQANSTFAPPVRQPHKQSNGNFT